MTHDEIPPAAPAGSIQAAIELMRQFAGIVTMETEALRAGTRGSFESLTERKREYLAALQESLASLEPLRRSAGAADRERWRTAAIACEAALRENAKLIEGEQAHAAELMDELRAVVRDRYSATLTYGRDAKPRAGR